MSEPEPRKLFGWTDDGECKGLGEDHACGPGEKFQVQKCIPGTNEECNDQHKKRKISCELPRCEGEKAEETNIISSKIHRNNILNFQ